MIDSWPYLAVGFLFSIFANGRYVIPIATWIAPVFLLHALDVDGVPALAGVWLALFASVGISYRGLVPAPPRAYALIVALIASTSLLPYVAYVLLAPGIVGF